MAEAAAAAAATDGNKQTNKNCGDDVMCSKVLIASSFHAFITLTSNSFKLYKSRQHEHTSCSLPPCIHFYYKQTFKGLVVYITKMRLPELDHQKRRRSLPRQRMPLHMAATVQSTKHKYSRVIQQLAPPFHLVGRTFF